MKKMILAAMLLGGVMSAHAQYSIKATGLKLADGTKVFIEQDGQKLDSTVVSKGEFLIQSDKKINVQYSTLRSEDNQWGTMFWFGNDNVTINAETNELKGAPEEDLYQAYKEWMNPVWDEMRKVDAERTADFQKNGYANWEHYGNILKKDLKQKEDSLFIKFCDQHPRSYICLNHIYNCRMMDKYSFKRYAAMAAHLDTTAFSNTTWETFKRVYELEKGLEPGNKFPIKVEGTDVYGDKWSLDDYKGKYTLLVFAGPCIDEYKKDYPELLALHEQFKSKGYDEYDFFLASNRKDVLKHGAIMPAKWNLVSDYKEWGSSLLQSIELDHISQYYFLSPDGTILCHTSEFPEVKEVIMNTMKK